MPMKKNHEQFFEQLQHIIVELVLVEQIVVEKLLLMENKVF